MNINGLPISPYWCIIKVYQEGDFYMSQDKVMNRVKKLLNLGDASKNNSEAEAQSALLMAQRMMAENGLTMADVDAASDTPNKLPEIVQRYATVGSTKMPWWYRTLGSIIADNFRVKYLVGTSERKTKQKSKAGVYPRSIIFIGFIEDVERAIEVYQFAMESVKYHADRYARRQYAAGIPMHGLRDAFTQGFLLGLDLKFKEQVATNNWLAIISLHPAVVEAADEATTGTYTFSMHINHTRDAQHQAHAKAAGEKEGRAFEMDREKLKEENK